MKQNNHYTIISYTFLVVLLIIAIFTRTYRLLDNPPSLFSDEVDAGFQALSLVTKHTDYQGNLFPIHFHSFSDWRTPLYIYSIAISYLTTHQLELSVRLPAAIFSILTIISTYFLLRKITGHSLPAFFSAFFLTFSPWSLHYGRTGFEVSGMLFFITLGLYFFFLYLQSTRLHSLVLSLLFLISSIYFYSTAKLYILFILIALLIIWRKIFIKLPAKSIIILLFSSFLFSTPMVFDTVLGHSGFRFSYINIFYDPIIPKSVDYLRYLDILRDHPQEVGVQTSLLSKFFHNKYSLISDKFISNYISSFSADFLFLTGDNNARHGFGEHGLMYFFEAFIFIVGLYYSITKPTLRKYSWFFLILFLTAPIPFALTRDSLGPHSTRLILLTLPFAYFICWGLTSLARHRLILASVLLLYFFSFTGFWHYYFTHYPQSAARYWHYGIKQAIIALPQNNHQIYFSNKPEPILPFFLFYRQYTSATPINQHLQDVSTSYFVGKDLDHQYYFGQINWSDAIQIPPFSTIVVTKSEYQPLNSDIKDLFYVSIPLQDNYLEKDTYLLLTKKA